MGTEYNFNKQATVAFQLAAQESRRLGDFIVCSEHLLLAVIQSTSEEVLQSIGINRPGVVARIEQRLADKRPETADVLTPGCQTPWLKRAILNAQLRATAKNRPAELKDLWNSVLQDQSCAVILREVGLDVVKLTEQLS